MVFLELLKILPISNATGNARAREAKKVSGIEPELLAGFHAEVAGCTRQEMSTYPSHDHFGLTSGGGDREVGLGPELAERVL